MSYKAARYKAGVRLCDAAKALGVTEQAICQWEAGKNDPSVANLVKMSSLYSCSVDDLLRKEANNNENRDKPR